MVKEMTSTFTATPLNETRLPPQARSHHNGLSETRYFSSPGTLKLKGSLCTLGNVNETRGCLTERQGLDRLHGSHIIIEGSEEAPLYTVT